MVCTNAFGVGIHNVTVDNVINTGIPMNLEALFQNAGRGGRAGQKSSAELISSVTDLRTIFQIKNADNG